MLAPTSRIPRDRRIGFDNNGRKAVHQDRAAQIEARIAALLAQRDADHRGRMTAR